MNEKKHCFEVLDNNYYVLLNPHVEALPRLLEQVTRDAMVDDPNIIHKQVNPGFEDTHIFACGIPISHQIAESRLVLGLGLLHYHHGTVRMVGTVVAHASENSPDERLKRVNNTEVKGEQDETLSRQRK
jgi:hypothetical protein